MKYIRYIIISFFSLFGKAEKITYPMLAFDLLLGSILLCLIFIILGAYSFFSQFSRGVLAFIFSIVAVIITFLFIFLMLYVGQIIFL